MAGVPGGIGRLMSDFSIRFGYEQPKIALSIEEMPDSLRNGLWDGLYNVFFSDVATYDIIDRVDGYSRSFEEITEKIWFNFFKKPTDTRSSDPRTTRKEIREFFFSAPFNKVYEFIEFMAETKFEEVSHQRSFVDFCNRIFERELSQFRFAGETLVLISDREQVDEVAAAIDNGHSSAVSAHIRRAAELYSHYPSPDYRNSIKEAISAVEAAVRYVVGEKSTGVSKPLRKATGEFVMHPALRDGFEKLYAYTSDEQGVRHAILDEPSVTQEDARYMLVSCSAFANYLIALKIRAVD
jgi:hypothetical protein